MYSTGEDLLSDGKLFIISRGLVVRNSMIKSSGSTWGEDFIFTKALRRPAKAFVLAFAELLTLTQDAFFELLGDASADDYKHCRLKIVKLTVVRCLITEARRRLLEDPSLAKHLSKSGDPNKSILWINLKREREAAGLIR